ncbi:MAG: TolC family protein [Acidobacteriia bacterium]|nr:TolC family protein [Terriglobia bacterium]
MKPVTAISLIAALLAAFGLPLAAFAQTTLTLAQAVTTALEKNPARKAAGFEKNAATADIKLARSALFPQIKFTEAYERGNDPVFVFGGRLRQQRFSASDFALNRLNTPTPFGNFATRFSGGWQLFDSGVSWLRLRQARRMDGVAQRKLQRGDQELVMRVVKAYAGLLLAVKQQHVAEEALKTSQSILDRSRAQVQAGMAVESDLLSAQVNHAARQEELILARNAVALARAQLNLEMGISPDTPFEPADLLAEKPLPVASLDELEKRALEQRPDLRGLTMRQAVQADGVRAAKASFGPRLNVIADWQLDNPQFAGGGGNNWMAGFELQVDVFDGGAKRARLAREHALKSRIDALHEAAANDIRLEVRRAYLDFDTARQQVEVARAAAGQAQESLRIGQNRYEAGLSTITDLLRMQEAALRAQTDSWQSLYRLQTSYAGLELATGALDLNSPVVKQ